LLLGDPALYERGVQVLRANHATLRGAQFHLGAPREVVVVGPAGDRRTEALLQAAWAFDGRPRVVAHLHDGNRAALAARSPVFVGKEAGGEGAPRAYVCERGVCKTPVTDVAALVSALEAAK